MTGRLDGKVAVVTGGGRGIGRAYAVALSAEGAAVVVNDLPATDGGESSASQVADEIVVGGGSATARHADVADSDDVGRLFDDTIDRFGRIDILVANAGNTRPTTIAESTPDEWFDVMNVHAGGTFNCVHHAAVRIGSGGGSIITTGDIQADLIFPGLGAYRSSKAAIAVLTLQAANELACRNINVNSVMPGPTTSAMSATFMSSLGAGRDAFAERARVRYGSEDGVRRDVPAAPESVPPLGVFLCTDEGRAITGRLFQLSGENTIRLVSTAPDSEVLMSDGARWTRDELVSRIPRFVGPVT